MKVGVPVSSGGSSATVTLPSGSNGALYLVAVETDPSETPAMSGWSSVSVSCSTSKLTLFSIIRGVSAPANAITGTTDHRVTQSFAFAPGTFDASAPFVYETATQESGLSITVECPSCVKGDGLALFVASGEDLSTNAARLFHATFSGDASGLARQGYNSVTTNNGGKIASFFGSAERDYDARDLTTRIGINVPSCAIAVRVNVAAETLPIIARYPIATTKPFQTSTDAITLGTFAIPASGARRVDIDVTARLRQYAAPLSTLETQSAAYSGAGTTGSFTIGTAGATLKSANCWLYVLTYHGVTGVTGLTLVDERTDYLGNRAALYRVKRTEADSSTYNITRTSGVAGRVIWFYLPEGHHDPDDVEVIFEDLNTAASGAITWGLDDPADGEPRSIVMGAFCTSGSFNATATASESVYVPAIDGFTTAINPDAYSASGNWALFVNNNAPLVMPFDVTFTSAQTNAHTGTKFTIALKRSREPLYYEDTGTVPLWLRGSCSIRVTVPSDSTASASLTGETVSQNIWHSAAVSVDYASAAKRTATIQLTTPMFTAAPIEVQGTVVVRGVAAATYSPAIGAIDVDTALPYIALVFAAPPTPSTGSIVIREIGTDVAVLTVSNASADGRVSVVGNELRVALDVSLSDTPRGYYVDVAHNVVDVYEGTYKVNGVDGRSNWYFTCRSVRQRVTNNLLAKS